MTLTDAVKAGLFKYDFNEIKPWLFGIFNPCLKQEKCHKMENDSNNPHLKTELEIIEVTSL